MANIYALFPCFSETVLLTVLDDVYQQDDRVVKDSDYWLLYMVLAIGSTAQSQHINDGPYAAGVGFVARAMSYADRALAPGYVTQIQSLLLLTLYALLDPAHFDSWHLIGFTARAVVDLGFHQDPPPTSGLDKSALDMRRRVFYCTYSLDRFVIPTPPGPFCFLLSYLLARIVHSFASSSPFPFLVCFVMGGEAMCAALQTWPTNKIFDQCHQYGPCANLFLHR